MRSLPIQKRNDYAGIYVHFPYCYQKCDYCDFYSEGIGPGASEWENQLLSHYQTEFKSRTNKNFSPVIDSIFIGGGTPSKASTETWNQLIQFFKSEANVSLDCEISIEMNPEDVTLQYLEGLSQAGFNRVNVGVQSKNPKTLQYLGRHYDQKKYDSLLPTLKNSPISKTGIDLIYGVPGQSETEFWDDLLEFSQAEISHISAYSLTMEPGTAYSRQTKTNLKSKPNEDLQTDILLKLPYVMRNQGYIWYEVSNFAKPGCLSNHNLKYWTYEPYLGIGPGAHGFWNGFRYSNPRNTQKYLKNGFSGALEASEQSTEVALTLFRLFQPFQPLGFFEGGKVSPSSLVSIFEKWQRNGNADFDGSIFQWKDSAVLGLNDFIFEIASLSG